MVIGTICIVFGVLGALGNAWSIVGVLIQTYVPVPAGSPIAHMWDRYLPWIITQASLATLLSILLAISGIGLARRSGWSPRLAMLWAIARSILVPAAMVLTFLSQRAQFDAMTKASPPSAAPPFGAMTGMMDAMLIAFVVVGLAWGLALPVFLIWWFRRPVIRREIADWK